MASRLIKLPRGPVAACMTCGLCNDLYDEATTISTCLHTFCKKCITDYFEEKECDKCPVCATYLGSTPEDKLRHDRSLQDIRMKLFPKKKRGEGSKKTTRSGSPPGGGKGKQRLSFGSSSSGASDGFSETDKKSNSGSKNNPPMSYPDDDANIEIILDGEIPSEDADLWEPLAYLIDASAAMSARGNGDEESYEIVTPPKRKRGRPPKNIMVTKTEESPKPVQANFEDKVAVWFALTPCEPKDFIPHLPARFLRIHRKSDITVEYIQKYIANKFGQITENDVEIKLMGETLSPDLLLGEVMRDWANDMAEAADFDGEVGDSSEEYLMPLKYLRK